MKKKQDFSAAQVVLIVFGMIAWVIAGIFAAQRPETVNKAPNNLAAAGALGFAVAGGLCFLGVGAADRKSRDEDTPAQPPPG